MKQKYLIIMVSLMMLAGTANAQMQAPVAKADYPFELTTDADAPILYYIYSGRDGSGDRGGCIFENSVPYGDTVNKLQIMYPNPNVESKQLWYFMEEDEGVKIISAEDNRMIVVPNTNDAARCALMKTTEELTATDYYVWRLDCTDGCYAFRTYDNNTFLSHNGNWQTAKAVMGLYNADGKADEGSRVFFEALPLENYPTAIERTIVAPATKDAIYTITGQRIENVTAPGIYIIGGKKRIVR